MAAPAAALALGLGVVACGDDGEGSSGGGTVSGTTLTVYSSFPAQGDTRPRTIDIRRGIALALERADNKAGKFTIEHVELDDSTAAKGKWDDSQTSTNARKAAQDDKTIAYIGEFNSGATAVSLPILNEAGILQVSPGNTAIGLTRSEGADSGEPDKYYPSGERTYGRVVPADHIQGAALAAYMKEEGVKRLYILHDKEVYGEGIADQVARSAKEQGIAVVGNDGYDIKAANFRAQAGKLESAGADAMFCGCITPNKAVQLFKDVAAAVPGIKLFGPDGVAESSFASKLGDKVENNVYVTAPTLDPKSYPPEGKAFFAQFERKYDSDPDAYAIYGYEAMNVVIKAIEAAGDQGNDRQAVIDAFFKLKGIESVLGTFDIDENGDTTLTDYGSFRVENGRLVFDKVIKATK